MQCNHLVKHTPILYRGCGSYEFHNIIHNSNARRYGHLHLTLIKYSELIRTGHPCVVYRLSFCVFDFFSYFIRSLQTITTFFPIVIPDGRAVFRVDQIIDGRFLLCFFSSWQFSYSHGFAHYLWFLIRTEPINCYRIRCAAQIAHYFIRSAMTLSTVFT